MRCRKCGRTGGELTENGCPEHGASALVEKPARSFPVAGSPDAARGRQAPEVAR